MLRINGSAASGINCIVSIPWYSTDGNHLLIPQGTLALGRTMSVNSVGQQRLFVTFERLIQPDGFTSAVQNSDGVDQIGQTGLHDKVDHHVPQVFGAALALAAIGGLAQIGNTGYSIYSPGGQYRTGITESLSASSMRILERYTSILPTFVVREGARNSIYIAHDLYLPDYEHHQIEVGE
jgi:type IV secretion system protein VirB10